MEQPMAASVETRQTRLPACKLTFQLTMQQTWTATARMSSPLSIKRRRLNESTAKLSKPFVSPLRTSKSDTAEKTVSQDQEHSNNAYLPSIVAHGVRIAQRPLPTATHSETFSSSRSSTLAKSTRIRKQSVYTTFANKRKDPAELQAERAITAVELQIRSVKNDIDTLNQASRISSSTTDSDLELLSQKWKAASQTAADELFGTVKERVNRMGGVEAWKESERMKYERANGLGEFAEQEGAAGEDGDADCEFDSAGEELPEEEQEWRKAEKRRIKKEALDAADIEEDVKYNEESTGGKGKAIWQEGGGEDDVSRPALSFVRLLINSLNFSVLQAFTMDMMLRSLNIELQIIGYDKQAQRWAG